MYFLLLLDKGASNLQLPPSHRKSSWIATKDFLSCDDCLLASECAKTVLRKFFFTLEVECGTMPCISRIWSYRKFFYFTDQVQSETNTNAIPSCPQLASPLSLDVSNIFAAFISSVSIASLWLHKFFPYGLMSSTRSRNSASKSKMRKKASRLSILSMLV